MSPVFIGHPPKMCSALEPSSLSSISLNNTQIRTLINIYPPSQLSTMPITPSQNFLMTPLDLRKHPLGAMSSQALYHYYFSNLHSSNHVSMPVPFVHQRENKRSNESSGKKRTMPSYCYFFLNIFLDK